MAKISQELQAIHSQVKSNVLKLKNFPLNTPANRVSMMVATICEDLNLLEASVKELKDAEILLSNEEQHEEDSIVYTYRAVMKKENDKWVPINNNFKEIAETIETMTECIEAKFPELSEEEVKPEEKEFVQKEFKATKKEENNTEQPSDLEKLVNVIIVASMPAIEATLRSNLQKHIGGYIAGAKSQKNIEFTEGPVKNENKPPVVNTKKKEKENAPTDEQIIAGCKTLKEAWATVQNMVSYKALNANEKFKKMTEDIKTTVNKELQDSLKDFENKLRAYVMGADWISAAILIMYIGISKGSAVRIISGTYLSVTEKAAEIKTPKDVISKIYEPYITRVKRGLNNITASKIDDLRKLGEVTATDEAEAENEVFAFGEKLLDLSELSKLNEKSQIVLGYLSRPKKDIHVDETPNPTPKNERPKKVRPNGSEAHAEKVSDIINGADKKAEETAKTTTVISKKRNLLSM